jgi:hypothetical protein
VNPKQNKKEGKMIVTGNSKLASASLAMRALLLAGAFAGLAAFMAHEVHARPGGGGFRGGAGFSGLQRPSGFGGFQRPSGGFQRPGTAAGQRPNGQAARSGNFQGNRSANGNMGVAGNRSANGNTGIAGNRTGNTGVAGNGNGNSNSGAIGSGNGNTGVVGSGNVNNGNVAVGNDVDVNVGNTGWAGGYYGYPAGSGAAYATGVAVGTATTATAAAVGSYYSTLPTGCSSYVLNGYGYYACGGTWYQQRYQGGSVTYVVVADPTKSR